MTGPQLPSTRAGTNNRVRDLSLCCHSTSLPVPEGTSCARRRLPASPPSVFGKKLCGTEPGKPHCLSVPA